MITGTGNIDGNDNDNGSGDINDMLYCGALGDVVIIFGRNVYFFEITFVYLHGFIKNDTKQNDYDDEIHYKEPDYCVYIASMLC